MEEFFDNERYTIRYLFFRKFLYMQSLNILFSQLILNIIFLPMAL